MDRHRGQSLVELALITPILLIMILISVDGARVFTAHIQIGNAAREGASVASRSTTNACDELIVQSAALQEVGPAGTIFGVAPTVDIQYPPECGVAETCEDDLGYACARVTVNYEFDMLFDFPGLPGQIDLERSAQMRMLGGG
ncbi:MAG: TadE/TadG family type IV pilus assembly protein [Thermomicrobiaceae bacterium]